MKPPAGELHGTGYLSKVGAAGAVCASLAHIATVPVDVVKTRCQIEPARFPNGAVALRTIVAQEGLLGLGRGFLPTSVGYAVQGFFKFGVFEALKGGLGRGLGAERSAAYAVPLYMVSASLAEVAGSVALCPFETIRIRMVANPHGGRCSAVARDTLQRDGVRAFYRGLGPILLKQVPYTMVQLTVFQRAVDAVYLSLLPRLRSGTTQASLSPATQLLISVLCGAGAGVAGAIASHPADTLLSQVSASQTKTGLVDLARRLGWSGLSAGIGPRCVMVSALSAIMFLVYDSARLLFGLPTTGKRA